MVEGRNRAGGRVHTTRLRPSPDSSAPPNCTGVGELGGSVLTSTDGNPLVMIARQLGAQLHSIRDKCPLYSLDGSPVPEDIDFKVRDAKCSVLCRQK